MLFVLVPVLLFTGIAAQKWKIQLSILNSSDFKEACKTDTFNLNASDYPFLLAGTEFVFENERFDVCSVQKCGERIKVIAICDQLENELITMLNYSSQASRSSGTCTNTFIPDWIAQTLPIFQKIENISDFSCAYVSQGSINQIQKVRIPPPEGNGQVKMPFAT